MENILTIIALLWVIHTFIFSEADKQLNELVSRVKYALSLQNGVLMLDQLNAKQHLSVSEIVELGECMISNQIGKNIVARFDSKYREIECGKKFIIANLILLTFLALVTSLFPFEILVIIIKIYFVVSLFFVVAFYYFISQLPKQRYTKISVVESKKS